MLKIVKAVMLVEWVLTEPEDSAPSRRTVKKIYA